MNHIQIVQNATQRRETGSHQVSSIDHLHQDAKILKVKEHSELFSVQYLIECLDEDHICHNITEADPPPRQMKETLLTKNTVEPSRRSH